MKTRELLNALDVAERLKDATRHCYTSGGRHESVAEHSWRAALMAFFMKDEFPEADINKVIRMCIIHDLGEAFTGDIPTFNKTAADEEREENLLTGWVKSLPEDVSSEMLALYAEMEARETVEAKIYKAIDNLEAVIQHNESDLSTWIPREYEMNLTYGSDKAAFSEYLTELRAEIRADTEKKIGTNRVRTKPGSLLKSTLNTRAILPDSLRFIRSDAPEHITEEEMRWLLDNGVTTVFDLRDESEWKAHPCPLEDNAAFGYIHAPVSGGGAVPATPEDVAPSYIRMVDGQLADTARKILASKSGVIYFCAAGKDRTGVLTALLLRVMGMTDEYIIDDYLLSGENMREAQQRYAETHPEADVRVITPQRSYMTDFLAWLDGQDIINKLMLKPV